MSANRNPPLKAESTDPTISKINEVTAMMAAFKAEFIIPSDALKIKQGALFQGEFSVIYEGAFKSKDIIIKQPQLHLYQGNVFNNFSLEFFMAEASVYHILFQHPNDCVLQPFGVCTITPFSMPAIIMEHGERNLEAVMLDKNVGLTQGDVVKYACQVAKGLAHLHQYNIIHRDVKPANIIITKNKESKESTAKISDFGISIPDIKKHPKENQVYGTPPYMAPEIFTSLKYSHASDMWAFGMLCWELIARDATVDNVLYSFEEDSEKCVAGIRGIVTTKPMQSILPKVEKFPEFVSFAMSFFKMKPEERPTAVQAVATLKGMLRKLSQEQVKEVVPIRMHQAKN